MSFEYEWLVNNKDVIWFNPMIFENDTLLSYLVLFVPSGTYGLNYSFPSYTILCFMLGLVPGDSVSRVLFQVVVGRPRLRFPLGFQSCDLCWVPA